MPTRITVAQLAKVVAHSESVLKGVRRRLGTADPAKLAKELEHAESVLAGVRDMLKTSSSASAGTRAEPLTFLVPGHFLARVDCHPRLPGPVTDDWKIDLADRVR